jgi:alkyl hydroperoxide reductase subunit AhpC
MSTPSYDRAKHIVEVDERILAVFIVDSTGKISELFIAEDANINRSFIETIRTVLDIRFEGRSERVKDQSLGQHLGYIRV